MKDPAQERSEVLNRLARAVSLLEQSMDARLVTGTGTNIAYAITGARDRGDVAAVQGGVVNHGGTVHIAGPCLFGADESISRIVLTAMRFDPSVRSAAAIRYSKKVISALEGMLLECSSFDRAEEPAGISTMDWGVAFCCSESVPDVIYDRGMKGKEPLIRLFGGDPVDVTNNIIILSNRIMSIAI